MYMFRNIPNSNGEKPMKTIRELNMSRILLAEYREWVEQGKPKGGEQDGERETAQESAENLQAG